MVCLLLPSSHCESRHLITTGNEAVEGTGGADATGRDPTGRATPASPYSTAWALRPAGLGTETASPCLGSAATAVGAKALVRYGRALNWAGAIREALALSDVA